MSPRHFIPYRKSDIVELCLRRGEQSTEQKERFHQFYQLLHSVFHQEFHQQLESLKTHYAGIDPDADTRPPLDSRNFPDGAFLELLENLLQKANYHRLGKQDLEAALKEHSLFKIRLQVDFSEYEEALLFCRGESQREETLSHLFGLWKTNVQFTNYDRVVVYLKFRQDLLPDAALLPNCQPGATLLKLFQNVPKADLEMLFPNTEVRMRRIDKLLIGIPALVSGVAVITTKLGTTLVLLGTLLGFWLGLHSESVELNKATVLALLAGFGTLAGYLWKQFSNFRNRKLKFLNVLTENLYFKTLDNNAGVIHRLTDEAEEEECKEALLAYSTLLLAEQGLTTDEVDRQIETWFREELDCQLDFDVADALSKLQRLGLLKEKDCRWWAVPLEDAMATLDHYWDDFFEHRESTRTTNTS